MNYILSQQLNSNILGVIISPPICKAEGGPEFVSQALNGTVFIRPMGAQYSGV